MVVPTAAVVVVVVVVVVVEFDGRLVVEVLEGTTVVNTVSLLPVLHPDRKTAQTATTAFIDS